MPGPRRPLPTNNNMDTDSDEFEDDDYIYSRPKGRDVPGPSLDVVSYYEKMQRMTLRVFAELGVRVDDIGTYYRRDSVFPYVYLNYDEFDISFMDSVPFAISKDARDELMQTLLERLNSRGMIRLLADSPNHTGFTNGILQMYPQAFLTTEDYIDNGYDFGVTEFKNRRSIFTESTGNFIPPQ